MSLSRSSPVVVAGFLAALWSFNLKGAVEFRAA